MANPKLKIIIVGAGIAGLSAYIFLHKHLVQADPDKYSITIYEAYDVQKLRHDAPGAISANDSLSPSPPKVIGSAIGIGKNGLSVLGRMDDDGNVLKTVRAMGNTVGSWRMGTARGWKIVDASVKAESEDGTASGVGTVMIARQVVWEILRDKVLEIDGTAIIKKKITNIATSMDERPVVKFGDGSHDIADVLIGADGLRSMVRFAIFAENNDIYPQSWLDWILRRPARKKDYITPHYEGLTGLGGFVPASVLERTNFPRDAMAITFGPNGFFGHGHIGNVSHPSPSGIASREDSEPLAAWWSTFSSDIPRPYQSKSKPDDSDLAVKFDRERALKELLERHSFWADDSIQAILSYVKENMAIEHIYPTYTTPELPTWTSQGSIILIGDAAHALQPSSGQGACQALEDAETLSLFLRYQLVKAEKGQQMAIAKALTETVKLRRPRVSMIYEASQRMSRTKMDKGVVAEHMMYFFIWLATKMGAMNKYNEELFGYDLPREVEKVLVRSTTKK